MAALRALNLVALAAAVSCSQTPACSYSALWSHLDLDGTNKPLEVLRPVKNWTTTTLVQLGMVLDAILDVDEKLQTITNHIWIKKYWINEFLTWNSSDFCGIDMLIIPGSMLWIPDIIIQEDVYDDGDSQESPLARVHSNGLVHVTQRLEMTQVCRLNLYRFPFDMQTCNITFSSLNYEENLVKLAKVTNDSILTQLSAQIMLTEGEWKLVNIESLSYTSETLRSTLVYKITLQRKPFLYLINLILPLLFLLCLDLASFFISDTSGEKLGFKVTILLSIFVLLLILKDILPSTEDTLPLMAIYCVVVFTLVWINVLEAMLMSFLRDFVCCVGEEVQSSEVFPAKTQQEVGDHEESAGVTKTADAKASDPPLDPPDGRDLLKLILEEVKSTQKVPERQKNVKKSTRLKLVKIFDFLFFVLYSSTVVISQVFLFSLWNIQDL